MVVKRSKFSAPQRMRRAVFQQEDISLAGTRNEQGGPQELNYR